MRQKLFLISLFSLLISPGISSLSLIDPLVKDDSESFTNSTSLSNLDNSYPIPSESYDIDFLLDVTKRSYVGQAEGAFQLNRKLLGLSIDGGGIRGLMPALWLSHLESLVQDAHGKKTSLYRIFDVVGGTSIGGNLSLGVAADLPITTLVNLFKERATEIFPHHYVLFEFLNIFGCKHDAQPLENLLQKEFGETTLQNVKTDIFITACSTKKEPKIFDRTESHKLWQVARATSAAPTYFEAYEIDGTHYIDGGLWMNNPSVFIAGNLMRQYETTHFDDVSILSLGTGSGDIDLGNVPVNAGKKAADRIIDALMTSQSKGNHCAMKTVFRNSYYRINPELKQSIDLDDTEDTIINELTTLANDSSNLESVKLFFHNNSKDINTKLEEG